jgi:hypothetical protein
MIVKNKKEEDCFDFILDGKEYRRIVVEEQHAGDKSSNGGEYGNGYSFIPYEDENGQYFYKYYWTTADFDYCPVNGHYQECYRCSSRDSCNEVDDCEHLSIEEVEKFLKDHKYNIATRGGWSKYDQKYYVLEVNATGHDYLACSYDGGCIICHPCNHSRCNEKLREETA